MPELTIIQLSQDELKGMITHAVTEAMSQYVEKKPEDKLITLSEICAYLNVKRTWFEVHKKELIQAGMFKVNGTRNAHYRMYLSDLEKWMNQKKQAI